MAHSMIRARITLADGLTPGPVRQGSTTLLACFARGCKIIPDPLNCYPDEFRQYEVEGVTVNEPKKRGRPAKVKP